MFCGDLDHLVSYVKSEDLGMVRNHILLAPTNTKPLFFPIKFSLILSTYHWSYFGEVDN